jgi:16S rRNA (guanine527-N7)-methyltransferase
MISAAELAGLAPHQVGDIQSQAELLSRLGQRMLEFGSLRGVTSLKTAESIKSELILDSLAGLASLPRPGSSNLGATPSVCDIGTGGGVPGLVLAAVRPDLAFTLTDSASKKTTWVRECVDELGLTNVEVRTARLEILGREEGVRGCFDAVTAKALAPLSVLIELAIPLLRVGGCLIAYKGPALEQEIEAAKKALRLLHAEVRLCRDGMLADKAYRIAEIVKTAPTGGRYPRRDGVPQKVPL